MEARLFEPGTVPEWTTPEWYDGRAAAPHLEQEGHRQRLEMAARWIEMAIGDEGSVLDLGAGDGGLLSLLPPTINAWGYDLQQTNVDAAAARGVDVRLGNVLDLNFSVPVDVVVATEMLEHLIDPHELLRNVHDGGAPWLVASSPYTETAESHYEFHTFAWDTDGYLQMIRDAGYQIVRVGHAWICSVVLAKAL